MCNTFQSKNKNSEGWYTEQISDKQTRQVNVPGRHHAIAQKPVCLIDYDTCMGLVDKMVQFLQPYNARRKILKWYRKVTLYI